MAKIICLECGKAFDHLGSHLRRMHDMSGDEYRAQHDLPRGLALASDEYRAERRDIFAGMIDRGALVRPDQTALTEAARLAPRPDKTPADKQRQRERVAANRPGDHHRLPPGAKHANGRDADREREYQRANRARKAGDHSLMIAWQQKYGE